MNESVECLGGESSGCFAESIEDALDVADRMAEETTERYTHEEYRDFISESDAEMDYRAEEAEKPRFIGQRFVRNQLHVMIWIQKEHI